MNELLFGDRVPLTGVKRHKDGFLSAKVKAARTGIQLYAGHEIGRPELETVAVYRPADEVFARDSLGTFKAKAITDHHPDERVTADNDKELRCGTVMGIARDGETVAADVAITDAKLIAKIEAGEARELSAGYTAKLDWTPGKTRDGQAYDAIQRSIYVDHLAVVPEARGGKELRIGDDANPGVIYPISPQKTEVGMSDNLTKTVVVDGRSILTDAAGEIIISQLQDALAASKTEATDLADRMTKLEGDVEQKDGKIAALEKQVEDARVDPKTLKDMAKRRSETMERAKKLGVPEADMDDMSEEDMKKAAVAKKMGDAAVDWSAQKIDGAFASLDASDAPIPGKKQLSDGIKTVDKSPFSDSVFRAAGVKLVKEEA